MNDIKDRINNIIIEKFGINNVVISPESTFSVLGADAYDKVELILDFESEFNIKIPDENMDEFRTIGDVQKYIGSVIQESDYC